MRKYFFAGCGSALGAVARYAVKDAAIPGNSFGMPFDTILINAAGVFMIAAAYVIFESMSDADPDVMTGITAGFLGGFTTFSLVCRESVDFIQSGQIMSAFVYLLMNVFAGLSAAFCGAAITGRAVSIFAGTIENEIPEESDVI